jgi:HlyD family secretion protein
MTEPNSQSPPPRATGKKWLVPASILVGCVALVLFIHARRAPSTPATETTVTTENADKKDETPVAVTTTRASIHPMETVVLVQGVLTPAPGGAARVAASVPGRLAQVLVREGDRVAAGQLLAVLDSRAAAAQTQSASADVQSAAADAHSAALSVGAAQSDATNSVAQAQAAFKSTLAERAATIQIAQSNLKQAQSDLKKVSIAANTADLSNAVEQARLALEAAREEGSASTQAAQNALQQAQTDLQKTRSGARPQEVAQARQAVSQAHQSTVQAQSTRDRAATEAARAQRLFDKGIWALRQLEDTQTALEVANSALQSAQAAEKSAQENLDLVRAGAREEDVQAARLRVEGAQQSVDAAQKSSAAKVRAAQSALALTRQNFRQGAPSRYEDVRAANLKIAAARQDLISAQQTGDARVLAARQAVIAAGASTLQVAAKRADAASKRAATSGKFAALSAAQIAASQNEIRAPLAGVVVKRRLDPGEVADPATPILEIASPDALELVAYVSAEKGAAIRAGMRARVSTESAPHQVVAAQVSSVGQIDPQTNLLSVRLTVSNKAAVLRAGAFAGAEIIIQTKPLAVVVPKASVLARDGKNLVLVVGADSKAHERPVTLGDERGGLTEITSGLKSGERVIREGGYQLDDGAAVEEKQESKASAP